MQNILISRFIAMCLLGVCFSSSGCQAVLDRTVNNVPMFPEGNKIQRYAGGGTLGEQWTRDGQCRVILDWVSKVKQEFPALRLDPRGTAPPMGYYLNLFRDSSFVPVFGMSYNQMSTSNGTHVWQRILHNNGCLGIGQFQKFQKDFQPYAGILQYAFQESPLDAGEHLKKGVEDLNRQDQELAEAWRKIRQDTSSREHYQELLAYAKPIPRNLRWERDRVMYESLPVGAMPVWADRRFNSLWPSETQAFHAALDEKLKTMASLFGEGEGSREQGRQDGPRVEDTGSSDQGPLTRAGRQRMTREEFMERYSEKTVPNEKPYWTSESRDVVIKMSKEPWCIKGSRHPGVTEVHTTDSSLYNNKNPRLQKIFTELSQQIRSECPGMKELVLHGYLEKNRVFYAWVALRNGGQLEARMDVKQDQRERAAAKNKAAACKSAPIQNPWGKTGRPHVDEPNPCEMLLAVTEFFSADFARIFGPCSLLKQNGCEGGVDKDYMQIKLTHFGKGECDRNGDCTFSMTFHCENVRFCAASMPLPGLPLAGRTAFLRGPNGTWIAKRPTMKETKALRFLGLPVEQLCPEVIEAIRCPPRS